MKDEFENMTPEELADLKLLAKKKRAEYVRNWQRNHPDKVKEYQERHYMRQVLREKNSQEKKA